MSRITSQQMGGVQIRNSKQVEPVLPAQRVGILMGQGKGFKETWGYTNPCATVGLKKLTRKPRNGNAGVN